LTGLSNAADGCMQMVSVEEEAPKKACSRRTDIDKEVDMEIWTWYQDQQAKGSKPSWHEVSVCFILLTVSSRKCVLINHNSPPGDQDIQNTKNTYS
jgi:hypothetical protein